MIFIGCSEKSLKSDEVEILLTNDIDRTNEIVESIKSIDVINMEVDTNYMYNEDARMLVSDNYYFFINERFQLTCYEKATGKLMFSKNIHGRAQFECIDQCNTYVIDDKIVINDFGKLKVYDHMGNFCGKLSNTKHNYLLPMGKGYVSFNSFGSDDGKAILILDSAFNKIDTYFTIPEEYSVGSFIINDSHTSPDKYVLNDTLRFYYQYTFRLHYFPGKKVYHFITSNPIPKSLLSNPSGEFKSISSECMMNNYANSLYDLVENQDYISFKYLIGMNIYMVFISKHNNDAFPIKFNDKIDSLEMWKTLLYSGNFIYSDGRCFYMRASIDLYKYLKEHEDILDVKLKAFCKTLQNYFVDIKIDNVTKFYCKIEI